jgi:competence ComEA-like helix-hairpin-helix protein
MPNHKPGWQNLTESYFSFSASQRRAIFFILLLSGAGFVYNRIQGSGLKSTHESEPFAQAEIAGLLAIRDTLSGNSFYKENQQQSFAEYNRSDGFSAIRPVPRLYFFDPNTATLEDLLALGLREKTAQNLVNYRQKGGKFKRPEDLAKLYSLSPEDAKRLIPYVRIDGAVVVESPKQDIESHESAEPVPFSRNERIEIGLIDINLADSVLLQMLPGIGAKRAASILRYRERLGGFLNLEQVRETPGLPDSVFQKIEPRLQISGTGIQKLSINTATETQLKNHPYIGWQWAKLIINYRNQHGNYKSVDDLLKIHVVRKDWLDKVRPYLKVEE